MAHIVELDTAAVRGSDLLGLDETGHSSSDLRLPRQLLIAEEQAVHEAERIESEDRSSDLPCCEWSVLLQVQTILQHASHRLAVERRFAHERRGEAVRFGAARRQVGVVLGVPHLDVGKSVERPHGGLLTTIPPGGLQVVAHRLGGLDEQRGDPCRLAGGGVDARLVERGSAEVGKAGGLEARTGEGQ